MVLEIEGFYACEECHMVYKEKELAQQCEEWCKEHKSCNLQITKNAIGVYEEECDCGGECSDGTCSCNH